MPSKVFIVCSLLEKDEKASINVFNSIDDARTCSVKLSTRERTYRIHEKVIDYVFEDSPIYVMKETNYVYLVYYAIPGNRDVVFHAFNNEDAAKACYKFYDERIYGPVFLEKHEILSHFTEDIIIKEKDNG